MLWADRCDLCVLCGFTRTRGERVFREENSERQVRSLSDPDAGSDNNGALVGEDENPLFFTTLVSQPGAFGGAPQLPPRCLQSLVAKSPELNPIMVRSRHHAHAFDLGGEP